MSDNYEFEKSMQSQSTDDYSPYVMNTDEVVNFDKLLLTMEHNKICDDHKAMCSSRLDDRDDGMVESNSETLYGGTK